MKLIHTADLHLDSRLNARFSGEKRKERKNELLMNFERLADHASSHGVSAVLISGDLFDRDRVSETAAGIVRDVIRAHDDIEFFYLKGNHDMGGALSSDDVPANLHTFGTAWQSYTLAEDVMIHGLEITGKEAHDALTSLKTDPGNINIVMLHGQITESRYDAADHAICLPDLRYHEIDYLALGHIHDRREGRLDQRGIYVYPGCLEGRGFDECGEHGFTVLDIDTKKHRLTTEFVPFAKRTLFREEVDITGLSSTNEILTAVKNILEQDDIQSKDMVQLHLMGFTEAEAERDLSYISAVLEEKYYLAEVCDETVFLIHPEAYQYDETLKGVFVRQVLEDESLSEEEKAAVIRYGFLALKQEEL